MSRLKTLLTRRGPRRAADNGARRRSDANQLAKRATNWTAIAMFVAFVDAALGICTGQPSRSRSAAQFYTAGSSITSFQNSLAIAGDYMSASFLSGISGLWSTCPAATV